MNNKILIESGIKVPNSETQQSFSKVEDSIETGLGGMRYYVKRLK